LKLYVGYVLSVIGKLKYANVRSPTLEQRQTQQVPTEDHNDSWYFQAAKVDASSGKQIDVVMRLGFREQKKYVETWFYMRHPEFGDDVLTHPQTRYPLVENEGGTTQPRVLRGGPLTFECVEPFKRWKIVFEGELVRHKPFVDHRSAMENTEGVSTASSKSSLVVEERFQARAEFVYSIDTKEPFNFDTQLDDWATARTLAREPWSASFFSELTKRHQTHYEQNGELTGALELTKIQKSNENNHKRVVNLGGGLRGMRDHSFGSREWGYIHRWVALFGCLDDGSSFNLVLVRMPTLTRVVAGYFRSNNSSVPIPVVDAKPELHQLGEKDNAAPPRYSFEFKLQDGRWLSATCDTEHLHLFVLGDPQSSSSAGRVTRSLLYEGLARYTINGVKGTGISEFTYAIP